MPAPPARRRLLAAVAVVGAVLVVLAGCSSSTTSAQSAPSTPIGRLDTTGMSLPRLEFCALLPDDAVRSAVGGKSEKDARWGNGDRPSADGVPDDVVHELGCSWTGPSGWTARAWVFAQPVEKSLARHVVSSAGKERDCRAPAGPEFGDPSYTQVCAGKDRAPRARHAGLFGQSWLTCEVEGPRSADADEVRTRADRWCVSVLNALDAATEG